MSTGPDNQHGAAVESDLDSKPILRAANVENVCFVPKNADLGELPSNVMWCLPFRFSDDGQPRFNLAAGILVTPHQIIEVHKPMNVHAA